MSKSGFTSLLAEDAATLALNLAETLETDTSGVTLPRMNEESSPITGHVDDISPEGITGWVVLRSDPTYRCVVLLKEGGRVLAQAVASQFRGDLEASGVGDGCHAFVIEMPPSVLDGAEHEFSVVEQRTELPILKEPIVWAFQIGEQATKPSPTGPKAVRKSLPQAVRSATIASPLRVNETFLFDVSDLVYYVGHHSNLTGIQRVQSGIVMSIVDQTLLPATSVMFISFDAVGRRWVIIPSGFFIRLLKDLFAPEERRIVKFPAMEARHGLLPGAYDFKSGFNPGRRSVLCLLGAAWVQHDYFHRILTLKRDFGTRFVMMVHDLIPIYARHTCDQGTVTVFEIFMRRAIRHVDHFLSVSENTASDLRRYAGGLSLPEPGITVTRNGSSFDEFIPEGHVIEDADPIDLPERFVLFVSTIEGRKNHKFVLDLWSKMLERDGDAPVLICVGRVGWRSEGFVAELVESDYLDGRVLLLQEVSDAQLHALYQRCLFTLYPSLYEGWGLPVGESLAAGKVCICSDRSSIPEVAGDLGVYVDIDNLEASLDVIRPFVLDDAMRQRFEDRIRLNYHPTSWATVAGAVVVSLTKALLSEWSEPYPYPLINYSSEISFAAVGRHAEANMIGPDLLNRVIEARRGFFLYENLREESFLRGEEIRAGGKWAEPETWGTWMCHASGDIVVGLPQIDKSNALFIYVRVRASGATQDCGVTITADNQTVWTGTIGGRSRNIGFKMRSKATSNTGPGTLKIGFSVAISVDQERALAAVDSRVPTLGLERLVIVPSSDLETRVDVMTRMMQ